MVYETAAVARDKDAPFVEPELLFQSPGTQLNSRFTFDTFVVGSCNQFAHAAARAVATKPSKQYNPPVHLWRCGEWARRT